MLYAIIALSIACAALAIALVFALRRSTGSAKPIDPRIISRIPQFFATLNRATDEQTDDVIDQIRGLRAEMTQMNHLTTQALEQRLDAFDGQQSRRSEQEFSRLRSTMGAAEQRQAHLEQTVSQSLERIRQDNEQRLEQMRQTVDEKLSATLTKRLDESFQQVGDQLRQVYTGLGEMQRLAGDLGDFKRVLTNVKSRGTWAEVQLGALLEQMLAPEQFVRNACVVKGSLERVEFAIKLPGDANGPVLLPIDSKFPQEDYLRIVSASEHADAAQLEDAVNALRKRLLLEAQKISTKYINPPTTTDFAVMFLPTEGLYSEALRMDGLSETLQNQYRVMVAGPGTLYALLNSLRVGFQTLAIQQRSSEVWQLLGTVKSQYADFTALLERTRQKLGEASGAIDRAEQRSRAIQKSLSGVERLDGAPDAAGINDELQQYRERK